MKVRPAFNKDQYLVHEHVFLEYVVYLQYEQSDKYLVHEHVFLDYDIYL